MEYTAAQLSAIETRGCSLLVAAGAGSGKTRVLTERIIRLLTDEAHPADITKMLVVTFTNAAAEEMVVRIRGALSDRLSVSTSDAETARLLHAVAMLPTASVCTIDSFCLNLVKSNFEKLGIPPKMRVGLENEANVLLKGVTDELIEEKMGEHEESPYFLTVYELLCGKKNDDDFCEALLGLYKCAIGQQNVTAFFDDADAMYREIAEGRGYDSRYGELLIRTYDAALKMAALYLQKTRELCEADAILAVKYLPAIENDCENVRRLMASAHTSVEEDAALLAALMPGSARVLPATGYEDKEFLKYIRSLRKAASDAVGALYGNYYDIPPEKLKLCAEDMRGIIGELRDLITKIDTRYRDAKRRAGMLEFSDFSRYAAELLCGADGEPTETAKELSARYDYIFIDEYQDVNPLQDKLLSVIARRDGNGAECNRFLVGDVKQSIYGFRSARPDIFEGYRHTFAAADEEGASRRKIFMQHNFRCAEPVIDFTNALFEQTMGQSYTAEDRLIFAKREEQPVKVPVKLLMVGIQDSANVGPCLTAEMEAVAGEIKELVGNPDVRGENGQMYTYGDVAVLCSKWSQAVALETFLAGVGIPAAGERGEKLFERTEIILAVSILRAVDNPERDIPLAAFARCAAVGIGDNELAEIRRRKKSGSFCSAVRHYASGADAADEEPFDTAVAGKCVKFLALLDGLRAHARSESVSAFIRRLYAELNLMSVCASPAFSNGVNDAPSVRRENLYRLAEIAREYDKNVYRGLSDFLEYIEGMYQDDTVKSAGSSHEDCVKLMTVHKSKGLEFPVCIVFGMNAAFRDNRSSLLYSERYGIAMNLRNLPMIRSLPGADGYLHTQRMPFRDLIASLCEEDEMTEAKRTLYVAVTRARDRLILSCCVPNAAKRLEQALTFPEKCLTDPSSRLDWLFGAFADTTALRDAAAFFGAHPETHGNVRSLPFLTVQTVKAEIGEAGDTAVQPEPAGRVDTVEPTADDMAWVRGITAQLERRRRLTEGLTTLPPKLTVSQLKHGLLEYEDMEDATEDARNLQKVPAFVSHENEKLGAERGTAIHQFLQFVDYGLCEREGAAAAAEALVGGAFLTAQQRELLDIGKLDAFFGTPLYARIKASSHVERELRFNLKQYAADVMQNAPAGDDFILVQGVIDCFFRNPDGSYTVLDFKTDRVAEEDGEAVLTERYANQLRIYARAVREITGCEVSDAILFSFALMKEVRVDVDD